MGLARQGYMAAGGPASLGRPPVCFLVAAFLCTSSVAEPAEQELLTAAGKLAEWPLGVFLGEPFADMQVVFDGGNDVREPYLAIAVAGTTPCRSLASICPGSFKGNGRGDGQVPKWIDLTMIGGSR